MSIQNLLAVALGGVVGSLARYLVYLATAHLFGHGFPYATLFVNVTGSFVLGALVETMALTWSASNAMRLMLAVGLLGSFTTFSTFAIDVVVLSERRQLMLAGLYASASVVLSIAAAFAGLRLMRRLLTPAL
jgi:CrcB protein